MTSIIPSPRRLALDTVYLVLGMPMGILAFTVVVTLWSTSLGLLITLIGIPLALVAAFASRGLAMVERRRAALVLGEPIRERYRTPADSGFMTRLKTVFGDGQTWRDLAWHLLLLPLGIAGFTIAVTGWSVTFALLTVPAWWKAARPHHVFSPSGDHFIDLGAFHVHSWGTAFLAMALGIASIPLTIAFVRGAAAGTAALANAVLGGTTAELSERVEVLTATRAGAVDVAAAELARIERDLHDGAQARLVAVAMDLGLAEQKLAEDPEAARALLSDARDGAREALAELRDLARGIRPALLTERGLGEAVSSFAARSAVPATVSVDLTARLPAQVESAAYFVVAEALTNVAKHSGASRATVSLALRGEKLEVLVADDGQGGANPAGGGLSGLRARVEALDGRLDVTSPPGGPTILRAELPCAS